MVVVVFWFVDDGCIDFDEFVEVVLLVGVGDVVYCIILWYFFIYSLGFFVEGCEWWEGLCGVELC